MKLRTINVWLFVIGLCFLRTNYVASQSQLGFDIEILNTDTRTCYNTSPDTIETKVSVPGIYKYVWKFKKASGAEWEIIAGAESSSLATDTLFETTSYRVIASVGKVPSDSAEITIEVFKELLANQISGPDSVCYGNSITLISDPAGGAGLYTVAWLKGGEPIGTGLELNIVELTETSTYNYIVHDDSCGFSNPSDPYVVFVYDSLIAGPISGVNQNHCFGGSDTLISHPSGGSPFQTIKWYKVENSAIYLDDGDSLFLTNLKDSAEIIYKIFDESCGFAESDPVAVNVYQDFDVGEVSGPDTTICHKTKVTLFANPTGGSGEYEINWFNSATLDTLNSGPEYETLELEDTTLFFYSVSDLNGCGKDNSPLFTCNVYARFDPGFIRTEDTAICSDQEVGYLQAHAAGGSSNYTYEWYTTANPSIPFETNESIYIGGINQPTTYYYYVKDKSGCGEGESLEFTVNINPEGTATAEITTLADNLCENDWITFKANASHPSSDYQWFVNDTLKSTSVDFVTNQIKYQDKISVEIHYQDPCITNNIVKDTLIALIYPAPIKTDLIAKRKDTIPVVLIYPGPEPDSDTPFYYEWYLGDSLIGTEKYYYSSAGIQQGVEYKLIVKNKHRCQVIIDTVFNFTKTIIFTPSDIFTIYPNPNHGEFTLELNESILPETIGVIDLEVFDLNGRVMIKKEIPYIHKYFDLSELEKGIYLIEVRAGTTFRQVKKLIIY